MGISHGLIHHPKPVFGILRANVDVGVHLAQRNCPVAFAVIAPPTKKPAQKFKLRWPRMGQAVAALMHGQDGSALRQGFDHVVKLRDKSLHARLGADPVDHRLHQLCGLVFFGS